MGRLKTALKLTAQAGKQSLSIQRRLMLYWACLLVGFAAALILVLNLVGVFSSHEKAAGAALQVQLSNTAGQMTHHLESLTAHSVSLSENISRELDALLTASGLDIRDLNDNPQLIATAQRMLFDDVSTSLQMSRCSGAYLVLDATTNTKSDKAAYSATGIYLRFANLSAREDARQDVVLYRGLPEIGRSHNLEMHNRWNLEFDIDAFPGYRSSMASQVTRLSDSALWTARFRLPDTWEDVFLLSVPILARSGQVCGLCGVELSTLYCYLSYPEQESIYGPMITTLSPMQGDQLLIGAGMVGGSDGTLLGGTDRLTVRKERYFNLYTSETGSYIGLHRAIPVYNVTGEPLVASVLIPESTFRAYAGASRSRWVLASLVLVLGMWGLSVILSRRFARPIVQTIHDIQNDTWDRQSGIPELDELAAFIRSKSREQAIAANALPPNIEELFHTFAENVKKLTAAELGILRYYIDGKEITEIPDLAFISIHTVKKHNSNIYQKLGVTSRDELMLYIELFRRCDRLEELIHPPKP